MDIKNEGRNTQYTQLCEDFRLYDRQFWQIPSILLVICSGIVGVSYNWINNLLARSALLFIGFLLAFGLALALIKFRFFQKTRISALKNLESDFSSGFVTVQRITKDGPHQAENWFQRQSAHIWLIAITFAMSFMLLLLSLINLAYLITKIIIYR